MNARNVHRCNSKKWPMQVWRMEQRRHGAFYELFTTLIKENRASPQATATERKLLEFCKLIRPWTDGDGAQLPLVILALSAAAPAIFDRRDVQI